MNQKLYTLFLCIILSAQTGCLYAMRYDGPYHGKIVDEQTREPIEGVVVLGTWSVYHFSPAGGYHTYYDAREAVTDKNGEFVIPGEGLRIFSSLEPMDFVIFKAGYKFREYQWRTLKIDIPKREEEQTKWEGDVPVFPIKKLTMEERKKQGSPARPDAPIEKMHLLTKEINKERVELGLTPFELGGGSR